MCVSGLDADLAAVAAKELMPDKKERIPIASDHAGFELKQRIAAVLTRLGFDVHDLGTNSEASTDYPDYAHPLAEEVSSGEVARGVLLCGYQA